MCSGLVVSRMLKLSPGQLLVGLRILGLFTLVNCY